METKYLNRQVKRNSERFPAEFMFQLTKTAKNELVTNWHRFQSLKHSAMLPSTFTGHGVAMLSSVLNSDRAIRTNILIIKTFVKLREVVESHKEIAEKLKELERRIQKQDEATNTIFEALRQLIAPPEKPKRRIGFDVEEPKVEYGSPLPRG